MDSAKNRGGKNGHHPGHEWEDAAFSWDNMKDDIFQKIEEEEPQFFEEKRKRRIPLWIWGSATALLLGGFGFWLLRTNQTNVQTEKPVMVPSSPAKAQKPIAIISDQPAEEKKEDHLPGESIVALNENQSPGHRSDDVVPDEEKNETTVQKDAQFTFNKTKVAATTTNYLTGNRDSTNPQARSSFHQKNLTSTLSSLPTLPLPPFNARAEQPALHLKTFPKPNSTKEKAPWKIVLSGGSLFSFAKYSGSSAAATLRNNNSSPYFGYQYGLDAWMPLSNKDYFTIGINRQVTYQNIDISTQVAFDTTLQDVLLSTTHHVVGNLTEDRVGDTTVTAVTNYRLVEYNEFKTVQLQAGYARVFQRNDWQISPFVRMAVGILTDTNGRTVAADQSIFAFDQKNPINNRFQISTQAGVAIERQLNQQYAVFFQYSLGQQWNNASKETDLTLRPASHSFSLGVSKKFW